MDQTRTIKTIEDIVVACGKKVLAVRAKKDRCMETRDKKEHMGQHFSTRADRESLELGLAMLCRSFPSEEIVAEEKENAAVIPPDCTVFDPLDGTTNFFNGSDDFGITMCMLRGGVPTLGATYFPTRRQLVSAVRGQGCFIGGFSSGTQVKRIAWHGQMDKIQIGSDIGSWTHKTKTFDTVLKPLLQRFNVLSAMSAIEGCRRVLFGQTVVYYNIGVAKIWDAAAMTLAIEEAGGVAYAPDGSTLQWKHINQDWVAAINPELAEIVLEHTRNWTNVKEVNQ